MAHQPHATTALTLLLVFLSIAPADAGLSPFLRFRGNDQWAPARETVSPIKHKSRTHKQAAEVEDGGDLAPVAAPAPTRPADLAAVELIKRYQMGTDTCGFAAEYKSAAWTCNKVAAACNSWGTNLGCCSGTSPPCSSTMISKCVDYTKDVTQSCATGALCCVSASPSCFTWRFSSSTAPDKTYSAYNCYTQGGTGTLVDQPPQLTQSSAGGNDKSDSSTPDLNPSTTLQTPAGGGQNARTSSSSSSSSSASTAGASGGDGGSSPNNTGAIVGGVVGGVAVIAIAGVAIFWMIVRNRRKRAASAAATTAAGSSAPPSMPASPPMGQHNSYYNYGHQSQAQGQDQGYLASMHQFMNAEQKPPEHGAGVATAYQANAPPQQQQYTNVPQEGWAGQQQYGQGLHPPPANHRQSNSPTVFSELGTVNPVGTQGNRAELGSGMGHR